MTNGWQMPWQAPNAARGQQQSTERSQVCAFPPLQENRKIRSLAPISCGGQAHFEPHPVPGGAVSALIVEAMVWGAPQVNPVAPSAPGLRFTRAERCGAIGGGRSGVPRRIEPEVAGTVAARSTIPPVTEHDLLLVLVGSVPSSGAPALRRESRERDQDQPEHCGADWVEEDEHFQPVTPT